MSVRGPTRGDDMVIDQDEERLVCSPEVIGLSPRVLTAPLTGGYLLKIWGL